MAQEALECFRLQTWPNTELVIVDDFYDSSFATPPNDAAYISIAIAGITLGEKRNIACSLAIGDYIVHWDSDDWSHHDRIADQVTVLKSSEKQVTGYHMHLYKELRNVRIVENGSTRPTSGFWRWKSLNHEASGTSLCYRRDWWKEHLFADVNFGEDNAFWNEAVSHNVAIATDGGNLLCATNHRSQSCERAPGGIEWEELAADPRALIADGGCVDPKTAYMVGE
jgi:glycosyltransferase involved in cell wall biosynthesis